MRFSSRYSSSGSLRVTDVRSRVILAELSAMVWIRNVISLHLYRSPLARLHTFGRLSARTGTRDGGKTNAACLAKPN